MDEGQAVFAQLTVSDFKKWSSTALKDLRHFWKLKAL